jgi:hypothetical protein
VPICQHTTLTEFEQGYVVTYFTHKKSKSLKLWFIEAKNSDMWITITSSDTTSIIELLEEAVSVCDFNLSSFHIFIVYLFSDAKIRKKSGLNKKLAIFFFKHT